MKDMSGEWALPIMPNSQRYGYYTNSTGTCTLVGYTDFIKTVSMPCLTKNDKCITLKNEDLPFTFNSCSG